MIRHTFLLSSAVVLGAVSPAAAGTTFFNNFPYNQYYGYFVCGSTACDVTQSPAMQFVSGATGTTNKVSVSVSPYNTDYTANVQIMIRADRNGLPGKVLAKKNVTAQPCCVTTTVKMQVPLTAGTPYWLEVAPRTVNDYALWQNSDSTDTCTYAENYGTGWVASQSNICPAVKIAGQ